MGNAQTVLMHSQVVILAFSLQLAQSKFQMEVASMLHVQIVVLHLTTSIPPIICAKLATLNSMHVRPVHQMEANVRNVIMGI